jgi:hypothetical protein
MTAAQESVVIPRPAQRAEGPRKRSIASAKQCAHFVGSRPMFRGSDLIANGEKFPEWKPGTEFKAVRDKMMRK